jgi:hypothetical protein
MSRYDRPTHKILMTFFLRTGWLVQFCEADLKTPLPRTFTFADPEKIRILCVKCYASDEILCQKRSPANRWLR